MADNITATATVESDINFTLIKIGSNTQNESASLNYSESFVDGTISGSNQINYGVILSGSLTANERTYLDMQALTKEAFDINTSVQFSTIRSMIVENRVQVSGGGDIGIAASGVSTGLFGLFNGGTGMMRIKPRGTYIYSDVLDGLPVTATARQVILNDMDGSGAGYRVVVVGVTG